MDVDSGRISGRKGGLRLEDAKVLYSKKEGNSNVGLRIYICNGIFVALA